MIPHLFKPLLSFIVVLCYTTFFIGEDRDRIVVACVGDSITFGARLENRTTDSYPAQLQQLLGDRYHVANMGVGGCTLIRKGKPSVWNNLTEIIETQPDIVVISLGTNDTCGEGTCGNRKCWEYRDSFKGDCEDLIDTLGTLPSNPKIWVCAPTPMVLETPKLDNSRRDGLTLRKPRLQILIKLIEEVVKEKKLRLIDLNTPLDHRPELFTEADGVHPNPRGYRAIAELVYAQIKE
jgi:sialate O-acetylesterase